jgi:formylmethanofuran--tetrahydromethanopterin N-formyltransferase
MIPKTTESENKLKVTGYDEKDKAFIVTSSTGHTAKIVDTFAEMFSMWVGRVLITAENEKWALTAARVATGFASSIIMSPAEAGIEGTLPSEKAPDKRTGVLIQFYHRTRPDLKAQMILRIGQCIMTCPTTAAYDALTNAKRHLKVGRSIRLFGDGYQRRDTVAARNVWRIPVMEGEFIVEDTFGTAKAIAGGNFLIMAENRESGLKAAEEAVDAIYGKVENVIMPFPGGICRSGSKADSQKYKLAASTFHQYCPRLRKLVPDSKVPEGVHCVYEIVINGLTVEAIKKAMGNGIKAAVKIPGVVMISAGNYGGKLGPFQASLREVLGL